MAVKIKDLVKPASKVVPMVYAYTTPGVTYHDGYIKIIGEVCWFYGYEI